MRFQTIERSEAVEKLKNRITLRIKDLGIYRSLDKDTFVPKEQTITAVGNLRTAALIRLNLLAFIYFLF